MTFAAIIQARMGSTRLPEKTMKPLGGIPLIGHVARAAAAIEGVETVLVATTEAPENRPLIEWAEGQGLRTYAGSEHDVLDRYLQAAKLIGCDYIVRVTGDNPFTDVEHGSRTVSLARETKADVTALIDLPLGCAVEIIKTETLEQAWHEAKEPYQREHVSPYIKENPQKFKIMHRPSGFEVPFDKNLRLTIDTEEDFCFATEIFDNLYRGDILSLRQVLSFLEANPQLSEINCNVQQRTMKHSCQ